MRKLKAENPGDFGIRVWLDGQEVTNDCFAAGAPDEPGIEGDGWVDLYLRDEQGDFSLVAPGATEIKWERRQGKVRWEAK